MSSLPFGPSAGAPTAAGGAGSSSEHSNTGSPGSAGARPQHYANGASATTGAGAAPIAASAPVASAAVVPAPSKGPSLTAFAFSAESAKVLHLVRHGQGFHNVEAAILGAAAYKKESLKDARLDETGCLQATTLGQRIREARMIVDVVLVSPLTRTLETATLMFPAGTTPPPPRFVAVELCREAHGGHPCDQRRPISVIRPEFPHVDFSGVETDEDTWHNPDRRETVREVSNRCDKFLAVLRARPERNLVVVSHGVFLETLLNRCGLTCTDESIKNRRFENAEMRSVVIGGWMSHPSFPGGT